MEPPPSLIEKLPFLQKNLIVATAGSNDDYLPLLDSLFFVNNPKAFRKAETRIQESEARTSESWGQRHNETRSRSP